MIPLPNITDFLGTLFDWALSFMQAYWQWLGLFIGIALAFIILKGIIDALEDKLEWNELKDQMLFDQSLFKELLGGKAGEEAWERYRLFNNLSKSQQHFLVPRDMYAGESINRYFDQPEALPKSGLFLPGVGLLQKNKMTKGFACETKKGDSCETGIVDPYPGKFYSRFFHRWT